MKRKSVLSQSQAGIYYACQGENANYQCAALYPLPSQVDVERLKSALEAVVNAHPYMCCHVENTVEGPFMVTGDTYHIPIVEAGSIDMMRPVFCYPMDLDHGPLFRLEIYRTLAGSFLYFDFHHIIFDGSSFATIMADITSAYNGEKPAGELLDGSEIAETELAVRNSDAFQQQRDWYIKTFAPAVELECLPVASAIERSDSQLGVVEKDFRLDLTDTLLKSICTRFSVKTGVVLTAAWGKLLADWSAQDKALFSTIFHGRTDERTRRSITMMVRTLPVYMEMGPEKGIGEWLREVSDQMEATREKSAYSFSDMHQDMELHADSMFAYHGKLAPTKMSPLRLSGFDIEGEDLRKAIPGTVLNAQMFNTSGAGPGCDFTIRLSYDSALYSSEMIESMVESYTAIVKSMAVGAVIADISPVSEAQTEWLDGLNPAEEMLPDCPLGLLEQFRGHVALRPDHICCVSGEQRYTYRQIDEISDGLAADVLRRVHPVEVALPVVSFVIPRGEWMVIVPLAIVKAGCTYQPLDGSYPAERLNFMVKDSKAQLLVCTEPLRSLLDEWDGEVLQIDNPNEYLASPRFEFVPAQPDDTMLLLYTSGTTGTPKGVMLTYRNVLTFCKSNNKLIGLDSDSIEASYASYGFDAFVMDLWDTLTSGAVIHLLSDDVRFDMEAIRDYLNRERVSHLLMTTQVGTQLVTSYPDLPYLKVLCVGGEKLASVTPPGYTFYNMYGPTESLCYVTYYKVEKEELNIPIGRATDTARLYVVNKAGKRLPMGAAGELWIAGTQVSKGYLGQPEKTAASFIDNPFCGGSCSDSVSGPFSTVYRTGDIVRYREDGEIEFVGRRDGQVKIRGFRVELKEVESVIRSFPGIQEATVQAFDLDAGGKAIAAYVVSDEKVDVAALNAFILEEKPPYMVPAMTMQIDAIPLNVNGKVDVKKLPEPKMQDLDEAVSTVPLNALEQQLMDIISSLTGCGKFSVTTPLAYVGLTSISGIKLSAQLFKHYGISLSNKELDGTSTLQSIENLILERWMNAGGADSCPSRVETSGLEGLEAPLSNAQTGVFMECMKNPSSTVYNVPFIVRFPSEVSAVALKEATEKAIALHPLILAHFDNSVDPPLQRVKTGVKPLVTISDKGVDELSKEFVQPFDLLAGPLYRAVVTGHILLLDVHHLVVDGSSVSVLLHEICDLLDGKSVSPEVCSFFDYVHEEQKRDTSSEQEWFKSQLSTVEEPTSIPADLHGKEQDGRQAEQVLTVNHDEAEQCARRLGVTPAAVYLSALQYIAARYGNTKDVCLCTVSSGRGDVRIADTVGMFVNTLALVSHITDVTVEEYIRGVAEKFSRTLDNEHWPFARVANDYGISSDIIFIYQLGVVDSFSVGGRPVTIEEMELNAPKTKFSLQVGERDGKVCLIVQYNDALYSADAMKRLLSSLAQVLHVFSVQGGMPVSEVSILSPEQQAEVSGMHCPFTAPLPIRVFHQGMERWAAETPDNLAIIAVDNTLTYREFDGMANRIGNALLERGLKRGDAVVVLLPRRSTTIAAFFGVMKAGGAFIPCDPEYPTERIRLIAEDSGAPYVVTTSSLVENYGVRGVLIDDLTACADASQPPVDVVPDDLAYMIYTSGSTGRPKGVRVAHKNITTFITSSPHHGLRAMMEVCERICSVSTISFDASISEYGMALFNGRTFVFSDEQESKDPIALAALMRRTGADYFGCTSSRMLQYLELPEFVACIKRCKAVLQGGEKFQEALLAKLRLCTDAVIINGYGPTEISIGCNASNLEGDAQLTVGKPLPNYTEWILDKDGNELPVGVTGELCVGGEGVTQGYNNLPEKTAEKFITYRGMRAFKTGDYARWLPSGEVDILGRTDNQVKLRGLRIELGEVEGAISQVEGIKNVVVKICNLQGRDHLSAFFVADRDVDIASLKSEIGQTLTAYMVPTAYLQMDRLPISPNGKVDLKALPQPLLAQSDSEYVAPVGEAEKFYAETFASILGLERVGATDSFFDLGGTSLVVMKLVIAAQKAGYKLTYADVFGNPTPRALALLSADSVRADDGKTAHDPDDDIRSFDYSGIDGLLKANDLEHFMSGGSARPLGSVLLTGATGFLGIHVLRCLLDDYPSTVIHCLLRPKRGIAAKDRLLQMLYYYFERKCDDLLGKRIFVHEGDVTSPIQIDAHIDTVINCAALVKHFSKGTEIEDVNVGGVRNCIDFCLSTGARLIQISTYSVAGASVNGQPDIKAFDEKMLFVGQRIRNQYVHSKLMGERLLLDAVVYKGLDAKIMRVGNLSARSEDGEFQINLAANSFMGRLRIYRMLGALPFSAYTSPVEFSPIDETASAICLLAQTNSSCSVFHPYNSHFQLLGDVLSRMKSIGTDLQLVEENCFIELLNAAKTDPSKQEQLSAMLAYENHESGEFVQAIPPSNDYTHQVLLRMGFRWSLVSWDYIDQFLQLNGGWL